MAKETQSACIVETPTKGHVVERDGLAVADVLSGFMKNAPRLERKIILCVSSTFQYEFK